MSEIESIEVDDIGQLKLVTPRHRDIVIPLELDEARKLAKELNELIPLAKTKKSAFERRFPLYSWRPDYYSLVVSGGNP